MQKFQALHFGVVFRGLRTVKITNQFNKELILRASCRKSQTYHKRLIETLVADTQGDVETAEATKKEEIYPTMPTLPGKTTFSTIFYSL